MTALQSSEQSGSEPTDTAASPGDENSRLEELLRGRARELQEQKARTREAEGVVRDLMAQLHSVSRSEPPPDNHQSEQALREQAPREQALREQTLREQTNREQALRDRTVEAELARAEAQLRLDEVLGHLATLRESVLEREKTREGEHAALMAGQADREGRERGLRAALAEAEESRDIALARATLLQHDLMLSSEDRGELARELAEARENLELHMATARSLADRFEHGLDSKAADALAAQLSGTRFRLDEQERAATIAGELLIAARLDGQEQRRTLGALRAELSARQLDHREAASRVGLIERELERERDKARELAGESVRKAAEVVALRDELGVAQASAAVTRSALSESQAESVAVSTELSRAKVRFATEQQRALALAAALQDTRNELLAAQRELRVLAGEHVRDDDPRDHTEPGLPIFEPADSID